MAIDVSVDSTAAAPEGTSVWKHWYPFIHLIVYVIFRDMIYFG